MQFNIFLSKEKIHFFFIKPNTQPIAVTIFAYISMDGNVTKEIREDILKSLKTTFHRTLTLSFTRGYVFRLNMQAYLCEKKKKICGRQDHTLQFY